MRESHGPRCCDEGAHLFLVHVTCVKRADTGLTNHLDKVICAHSAARDYGDPLSRLFDQSGDSLHTMQSGARAAGSEYPLDADIDQFFESALLVRYRVKRAMEGDWEVSRRVAQLQNI